jgi:prepilin-type N-terminal cleavage/methylation domain-containing protein
MKGCNKVKQNKKAFTLIEMIFTLIILSILSIGTFISIKHLYQRVAKSRAISDLSSNSQVIVDEISSLLYDRVPTSVIGYNPGSDNFKSIYQLQGNFHILEWIGTATEALKKGDYSGFIDMDGSNKANNTVKSFGVNGSDINETLKNKFEGNNNIANAGVALIFSGAFDEGVIGSDFNNSFGWHGHNHNLVYDINITDNNISFGGVRPDEIYEKYYLVDSAYAIARGADINQNATCIKALKVRPEDINNTLFLFYNYRPWKDETFCADPNSGGSMEGNVTILSSEVSGFESGLINNSIYFELTLQRKIRGTDNNVTISKQKVVF